MPCALQVDTGMARMGMSMTEMTALAGDSGRIDGSQVRLVMSHLACAEDSEHPLNELQRRRFDRMRVLWPGIRASLANSSGIFLGQDFHYDVVRPGAALYGVAPVAGAINPMHPVVRVQARVVQVHEIAAGDSVGYGASWHAERRSRIATLSIGYADGFLRSISNRGVAWFGNEPLPLVGKVSMDSVTVDVSALPTGALVPGSLVDLINERHTVDAVASAAQTIGYEVLTSLGARYARRYLGA